MCVCVIAGGVLFPCGVSVSDRGGGDAHQTGAGQGRTGEVPAVQRHLQRYEEGKGKFGTHTTACHAQYETVKVLTVVTQLINTYTCIFLTSP